MNLQFQLTFLGSAINMNSGVLFEYQTTYVSVLLTCHQELGTINMAIHETILVWIGLHYSKTVHELT